MLQKFKSPQPCSSVSKNSPFAATVVIFPTLTYIARDNENNSSFSKKKKAKLYGNTLLDFSLEVLIYPHWKRSFLYEKDFLSGKYLGNLR